jgi:hypothetical protein
MQRPRHVSLTDPAIELFAAGALVLKVAFLVVIVPLQAQITRLDGSFEGLPVRYAFDVVEAVLGIGEFAF